jgi:hypothetical protein
MLKEVEEERGVHLIGRGFWSWIMLRLLAFSSCGMGMEFG